MEKTKWLTLLGSSLAVISSTALYINVGLFVVLGDYEKPFYANPYLNVMVFGFNLDSVLNDVGMLLACGAIKKITYKKITTQVSTLVSMASARKIKIETIPVLPAFEFDSKAYDSN